jgi:hypothetical protein
MKRSVSPTAEQSEAKASKHQITFSPEALCHVYDFVPVEDLFKIAPLVNSSWSTACQQYDWKRRYETTLQFLNIDVKKFTRQEEIADHRKRIQQKLGPLLQQRDAFHRTIFKKAPKPEEKRKLEEQFRKALQLRVHFKKIVSLKADAVPMGTSRIFTDDFDVPNDGSVDATNIIAQIDLSLLQDTFCANMYNLPTTGILYLEHGSEEKKAACYYSDSKDFERRKVDEENCIRNDEMYIGSSIERVALSNFLELNKKEFKELRKFTEYFVSIEDLELGGDARIYMFGSAFCEDDYNIEYFKEHKDRNLLFQYPASSGESFAYIRIDTKNLLERKFNPVYLDYHYE